MDENRLIDEVRNRTFLWDKSDKNHCNRPLIASAWNTIAQEVGGYVTAEYCKTRWTSIRDYFMKKHKETRAMKPDQVARKKKKWYLYDFLLFLVPTTSTGSTSRPTNLPDVGENGDVADCSDQEHWHSQISSQASPVSTQSEESYEVVSRKPLQRKRKAPARNTEMLPADMEIMKALREPQQIPQMDENEHFFKSLLPSLRQLDEVETMQFRLDVQQLVLDYLQTARARKAAASAPLPPPANAAASLLGFSQASCAAPTPRKQEREDSFSAS